MGDQRIVGYIHVDSAQILMLDPGRLLEWQYNSVIDTPRVHEAAEVWLDEEIKVEEALGARPRRTNDGVVIETGSDGSFPVEVEYGDEGHPVSIRIKLT